MKQPKTERKFGTLIAVCWGILARLDLEASEKGDDAIFVCSAYRADLRRALAAAKSVCE